MRAVQSKVKVAGAGWKCRHDLIEREASTSPQSSMPTKEGKFMASNRGIAYMGPGKVEVQSMDFPKLTLGNRKCEHGVILKIVSTNICGSDQHMVRGRTTAPKGIDLGHEITGEVIECRRDEAVIAKGDLASGHFNIACGRCRDAKEPAPGGCVHL